MNQNIDAVNFHNTLFELMDLSCRNPEDLDDCFGTIEIFFENEDGMEGSYEKDVPVIAKEALNAINHLQAENTELRKKLKLCEEQQAR